MTRNTILARLALAAALALPLAACGDDEPAATPTANPSVPPGTATQDEPEVGIGTTAPGAPPTAGTPPPAAGAGAGTGSMTDTTTTTTPTGPVPPPSPADPAASVDDAVKQTDEALEKVEPKPQGQ